MINHKYIYSDELKEDDDGNITNLGMVMRSVGVTDANVINMVFSDNGGIHVFYRGGT